MPFRSRSRVDAFAQDLPAAKGVGLDQVDTFLAIDEKGMVTVYAGKVELGTGVRTGLTQIVADELDVPHGKCQCHSRRYGADAGPGADLWQPVDPEMGGVQIRQAAATARNALLDEAAQTAWTWQKKILSSTNGAIGVKVGRRKGQLCRTDRWQEFQPQGRSRGSDEKPRQLQNRRQAGRAARHSGQADRTIHLYAGFPRSGHAAWSRGASACARCEARERRQIFDQGYSRHRQSGAPGQFPRRGSAKPNGQRFAPRGRSAATWSKSETLPDANKLWEHVRSTKIVKDDVTSNIGDASTAMAAKGKKLIASYDFTIHTHGSIGPSCAISEFMDGKLMSWSASQATHNLRKQLAMMFSMPLEDVRCIYVDGSGCYGRNGHEDAAADSALLAQAVEKPVRVQWSRADEHGWDPKGPPTLIDLRANVDASGNVTAWESEFFIPQGAAGTTSISSLQR